tara:strand:- start:420 stop:1082 length:663 start_codon:yes stop_codon:yes gene_type:complete
VTDYLTIPADGSRYLCDVAIDTEAWLAAVLGDPVDDTVNCNGVELWPDGVPDWDHDDAILYAVRLHTEKPGYASYERVFRDNVYNREQDFGAIFTFSVYSTSDDWYYDDDAYVAVCLHKGGDARGNYGRPTLYKADNLAESGFLDWMVGWYVTDANEEPHRINDKVCHAYDSNPTCLLESMLDGVPTDSEGAPGIWKDGSYHATIDGLPVICHPYVNVQN